MLAAQTVTKLGQQADSAHAERWRSASGGDWNTIQLADRLADITARARAIVYPERSPRMAHEPIFVLRTLTTARTLREAMEYLARFGEVFCGLSCQVAFDACDDRAYLTIQRAPFDPDLLFTHELRSYSIGLSMLNWLTGNNLSDPRAHFSYCPLSQEEMRAVFPYAYTCGASSGGYSLSSRDLRLPILRVPGEGEAFVRQASLIAILGTRHLHRYSDTVSQLINRSLRLHQGRLSVTAICDMLAISSGTLQRHLSAEGTSFREVSDRCANRCAKDLLMKPGVSVKSIAETLGYSDERAFRRAFIRWNGCSPSRFRQSGRPA